LAAVMSILVVSEWCRFVESAGGFALADFKLVKAKFGNTVPNFSSVRGREQEFKCTIH
jgi:hypothetical protein